MINWFNEDIDIELYAYFPLKLNFHSPDTDSRSLVDRPSRHLKTTKQAFSSRDQTLAFYATDQLPRTNTEIPPQKLSLQRMNTLLHALR